MHRITPIKIRTAVWDPVQPNSTAMNFSGELDLQTADRLLKTTRQYPRWRSVLHRSPAEAREIARLVLERHGYLTGKMPTDESGRRNFDRLTGQLAQKGIYLYKSHQLGNPVFTVAASPPEAPENTIAPAAQTPAVKDAAMVNKLRERYRNNDCLEFVAGILEENGIAYYGRQGVADVLVEKARGEDLHTNAYLTGEGVTRLLSRKPLTLAVPTESKKSFEAIWGQLEPHLAKGAILSFSSQHFGHTGIVDQSDGRWTYFNSSGIAGKPETYRIVAEDLKTEIQNWWQRAHRSNTFLDITIGRVDRALAARFNRPSAANRRVLEADIKLLA